jgi:hypothetical protein
MHRLTERGVTYLCLTIALGLIAGFVITFTASQSQAKARTRKATAAKPTVVLVNGAWANSAAWSGVIERLQTEGYTVAKDDQRPDRPGRALLRRRRDHERRDG